MKQLLCVLMLSASISGTAFAQQNNTPGHPQKTFELPPGYINRRFYIELHQHNEIQLGLKHIRDIDHIGNLDSLIGLCLQDLAPFKDSFPDELTSKKIDYTIEPSGRKEIRIRRYTPQGSSFLLQQGTVSALKLGQDTIHILAPVNLPADVSGKSSPEQPAQFEINIVVNQLSELPVLMGAGIRGKVDTLRQSIDEYFTRADWTWIPGSNHRLHLKKDPDLSEDYPMGGLTRGRDGIRSVVSANFQNYKTWFVPSFSLGFDAVFNSSTDLYHGPSAYKYELSLSWEPQFFFQNIQGKLQTYRNDFLALTFGKSPKEKANLSFRNQLELGLPMHFSIAYLINREGSFYDKNTFRVGVGDVSFLKDKCKLEPVIYFNNFFKAVTPGLRLKVSF